MGFWKAEKMYEEFQDVFMKKEKKTIWGKNKYSTYFQFCYLNPKYGTDCRMLKLIVL